MFEEATKIDLMNHALQLLPKVEGTLSPFSKILDEMVLGGRDSYKKGSEKSTKNLSTVFREISPKIKQK